jgi:hypothetical protein
VYAPKKDPANSAVTIVKPAAASIGSKASGGVSLGGIAGRAREPALEHRVGIGGREVEDQVADPQHAAQAQDAGDAVERDGLEEVRQLVQGVARVDTGETSTARSFTKMPEPTRAVRRPSAVRRSYAAEAVLREISSRAASSRVGGNRAPGRSRPSGMASSSCR